MGVLDESLQRLLRIVAVAALVLFALFLLSTAVQLAGAAGQIAPWFGTAVFWTLLAAYGFGFGLMMWHVFRLPRALQAPASADGPQYEAFLRRFAHRLRRNPELAGRPLETEEDIRAALDVLGNKADAMTREAALQSFFVTAISQNGNLDALAVLAVNGRLVYETAMLYYQRPTLRDLLSLYGNVAVSAVAARQLDEWDMTEYVTPVINASMGSIIGVVPGATAAASAGVQAVLTGSANAYLTLRVGVIAKRHCASLTFQGRRQLRDAAFVEAAKMFPSVVAEGGKKVGDIVVGAVTKASRSAVAAVGTGIKQAAGAAGTGAKQAAEVVGSGIKQAAGTAGTGLKQAAGTAGTGLRRAADAALSTTKGAGEAVGGAVRQLGGTLRTWFGGKPAKPDADQAEAGREAAAGREEAAPSREDSGPE